MTTNYSKLSWIEEIIPGETPANPTFQELPINSIGLVESITTSISERIRSDRMIDDLVIVDADVGGGNDYELSFKAYKPMIISLLQCNKVAIGIVAISGASDISADASGAFNSTITDFTASNVAVGMWLNVSGFVSAGNNGLHRITSVTANQIIVDINISTLVTESAPASVDMEGETYRNSNSPPENYTFKQEVQVNGTPYYGYYRGPQISEMTFDFETGSILTGAMTLVGRDATMQDSALPGESISPVADYRVMNSVSNLAINITGLPAGTVYETFNLAVNNNVNPKKGIGKLGAYGLGSFTNEVTAGVDMYFEDLTAYNYFKASTAFLSSFTLTDADGNIIIATIPACKFESLEMPVPGKDEFLMQTGSIRGVRDAITNCHIQFDFISAS